MNRNIRGKPLTHIRGRPPTDVKERGSPEQLTHFNARKHRY